MGVFKNRGAPKWMVYFMENPIKIDDFGGKHPLFSVQHQPLDPSFRCQVTQKSQQFGNSGSERLDWTEDHLVFFLEVTSVCVFL